MEQESGAASAGTFIPLNEREHGFYSGLHALCQADSSGTGTLSSCKVATLFKASQLPPETLHKVTEVCGAKRLGYFGVTQFYVALKLLAAAQSGLPIRLDSVTTNLPLPRFVGLQIEPELQYSTIPPGADVQGAPCGSGPGSSSWTPADRGGTFRPLETNTEKKEAWSPPRSPCASPPRSPVIYHSYPYNQQRNGLDAQTTYESKHSSRPTAQLEQHSSPSNYGTKPTMEHSAIAQASSVERLDQQAVVYHCNEDPWRITGEQLEYYTNQFKSLQPDLGALILGAVAKHFFTKSKLPIPELSHIWELSDVDRDGALTFSEFCTAFHLIVARKNGYPLPESLPVSLQPGLTQQEEHIPDTPEDQSIVELQSGSTTKTQDKTEESSQQDTASVRAGPAPETLTLRLPAFPQRPEPPQDLDTQWRTKTRPRSYSSTSIEDAMKKAEEPPTPPPRPQKTHSRASSLDLNKLFQQGAPGLKSGWLLHPPALPPRPSTSQVSQTQQIKVQQPNFADFTHFREEEESPEKPDEQRLCSRFGPSTEDLTNPYKQEAPAGSHSQAPQKPARRKYHPETPNPDAVPPAAVQFPPPNKLTQRLLSKQKREIQMAIRKNKETNAVLTRLNSELQQQLKVAHQERVTLESQLDLVRPLAST
ncbi:ralBP1-associated Eps domain-containing protein 2 isoform X2 [Gouania willdenowi]|uniref:RALBP1 associated Eps domain containing 2 n=1 Tax=Gouania willdenowi TaxID=441366 RepID=A0A8C5DJT0_GOUWI|nr:ralBP1-associated Eps domain-containing protein 2 isoform X2 [Gouania willdenowi]